MLRKDTKNYKVKRLNVTLQDAVVTKDASGECIIAGYANTSTKDRVGDVVDPKAFEKSLPTYMKNPVLLANHDWEDPIGVVTEAFVDEKGLYIKARISDTRADIKTLIREKCLRTFSIGYNELDADYDESSQTKYVKDLELLEISVVTVPANSEAMFDVFDQKAETSPEKSAAFVTSMKEFVGKVEKALERSMDGSEAAAVCSYFIVNRGDNMTTKELIEKLTKKSAPAPVGTEAKADGAAPAAEGAAANAGQPDAMKELMAKLDAIAQGMAKLIEMADKPAAEPAKEEPKKEPEAAKPADDGKAAESEDKPAEEECEEEDEEKSLEEIDAEIKEAEDALEALED